jgi:hypothetical protein
MARAVRATARRAAADAGGRARGARAGGRAAQEHALALVAGQGARTWPTGRAPRRAQAQAAVQARAAEAATRDLLRAVRTFDRTQCDSLFAEPVTDDIAEGYSSIIARPVDLKTLACVAQPARPSGACVWAGPRAGTCLHARPPCTPVRDL